MGGAGSGGWNRGVRKGNRIEIQDGTALVYLENRPSLAAVVDSTALPKVAAHTWHAERGRGGRVYVVSSDRPRLRLHRVIVDAPDGLEVDHINHDTLDNRASNLRVVTTAENQWNGRWPVGASGFRGVHWHRDGWVSEIRVRGRRIYLGFSKTPEGAARKYDEAAVRYRGPFAQLNFPGRASASTTTPGP